MAINFTDYFTRLGNLIGYANTVNTFRGTTISGRTSSLVALYDSAQRSVLDNYYQNVNNYITSQNSWIGTLQTYMQNTLIQMTNDDVPLPSLTLNNALVRLIANMIAGSETIQRPTLGSTAVAGSSNVGNGKMVCSTIDYDGQTLDYMYAEELNVLITNDSYTGGSATAGSEPYSLVGTPSSQVTAYNWPQGSGANTSGNAVDPNSSTTIITNGAFEDWTTNIPDSWTIQTGSYTTNYLRSTSSYAGTYAFEFVGDGATNTSILQTISLSPNKVYCLGFFAERSGSGAGAIQFNLVDGSNTVFANQAGTNNQLTITIASGLTTSYAPYYVFFQTPNVLPSTTKLQIKLSTAAASGTNVFIDQLTLTPAKQAYTGGPWVTLLAGSTPFAEGDTFVITDTNSLGVTSFARSMDRFYSLAQAGLKIPSSLTPTISDSLIT